MNRRIAKNFLSLALSDLLVRLLSLATTIILARYLGVKNYGILAFALSLVTLLAVITDVGIANITVREVARDAAKATIFLHCGLTVKTIIFVIILILFIIMSHLVLKRGPEYVIILILILSVLPAILAETFNSILQAFQKMEFISIGRFLNKLILFGLCLIAIKSKFEFVSISYLFPLAAFVFCCYSAVVIYSKFLKPKFVLDYKLCKTLLFEGVIVATATLCLSLIHI